MTADKAFEKFVEITIREFHYSPAEVAAFAVEIHDRLRSMPELDEESLRNLVEEIL